MTEEVAAFRVDYRAREIGPGYSGALHFAFTTTGSLAVIAAALVAVELPTAAELLAVPLTFLFANLVEYRAHRGPMHRRHSPLGVLFERHALQHHRFYTHEAMAFEGPRDLKIVLFPPVMLLLFLGGIALPVGLLLWLAATRNVAALYVATAMAYFLAYEWLHLAYHLPPSSGLDRLPLLARLRAHHQAHHDPALMARWNFNITFPIGDALYGTRRRG
jgi:hypothetical protein